MQRLVRWTVLLAIASLAFGACGGSTATTAPTTAASESAAASASASAAPVTPAPTAAGAPVTIKWFCCLGGGDDPSTLKVFDQVVKDFNASHPNINLVFDHV